MLISNIGDGKGAEVDEGAPEDHAYDYQTATELLDMMSRNTGFDPSNGDSLTTQDLILLYKNIDIGTKLLNEATAIKQHKPNQHVETVVYNDDLESDSDFSDCYSAEDITAFIKTNQERLDLFTNPASLENLLCHKFGGLKIPSSSINSPYNTHFMFQDPFLKAQLQAMNVSTNGQLNGSLPTSLLDYICCKRLEDNYTFYMDNIIKHVQHTIEQLKRISNGDFLTEQAKEMWKEVNSQENKNTTKILANSTSIPLIVECKNKTKLTWDDIVHSEVDVRSLSKILEKKIVLEIPKLMCGSYKLFSKQMDENFIISCKREKKNNEEHVSESRVDVVVQLQKLQTGQVMSNINSIMILQTTPSLPNSERPAILPLTYKEENIQDNNEVHSNENQEENEGKDLVEEIDVEPEKEVIDEIKQEIKNEVVPENNENVTEIKKRENESSNSDGNDDDSEFEANYYPNEEFFECYDFSSNLYSSDTSGTKDRNAQEEIFNASTFNMLNPNDLRVTMQRLSMQSVLAEESADDLLSQNTNKRRSPVRVRIKSPYENKSFAIEEKKRKKLLEIREKREKRKLALSETCKISKHKFSKGNVMPQASNSVTKLSITNKSFYNSIYGQNSNKDSIVNKNKLRKCNKKDLFVDIPVDQMQDEYETPNVTPEKNTKKYINRSYYLDEAETAIEMKNCNNDKQSTSASTVSNEFNENLQILSQFMRSSGSDFSNNPTSNTSLQKQVELNVPNNSRPSSVRSKHSIEKVQMITLNEKKIEPAEPPSTLECRKSIDKLYDLMKKSGKASTTNLIIDDKHETNSSTKIVVKNTEAAENSTVRESDSGTSLKHHLSSSNHSSFSFGKNHGDKHKTRNKNSGIPNVVPKIIINSKLKVESEKVIKEGKRLITSPKPKVPDNPIKTIAQLLHEFDSVQKNRQKSVPVSQIPEHKRNKKNDSSNNESKNSNAIHSLNLKRRSRLDHHLKEEVKVPSPRDKKTKHLEHPHKLHHNVQPEDKLIDKSPKKKIVEIIDEVKEARGEAVRGPPKNSRLYSLAQPKRSYVQAHSEEYQNRYGKNFMSHRLQKLAATPPSPVERKIGSASSRKVIRTGTDTASKVNVKQPSSPVPPIDKNSIKQRSFSCSPNRKSNKSNTYKTGAPVLPTSENKLSNVEEYLKNHYHSAHTYSQLNELSLTGNKSRVPVLPKDIEVESLESSPNSDEANELGEKLHSMVNSIVVKTSALSVLCETQETRTESFDYQSDNLNLNDQPSFNVDSDFKIDIMEDKTVETAVQVVNNKQDTSEKKSNDLIVHSLNSKYEIEKLENALYNQLSGTFQKRLRIKNLTLTPKQSLQKVFLLQSGDVAPLIVTSLSKIKLNQNDARSLHNLRNNNILENHLKWDYVQIPLQVATVGYTFGPTEKNESGSTNLIISNNIDEAPVVIKASESSKSDKVIQCFKGAQDTLLTANVQTNAGKYIDKVESNISKINDHKIILKENEVKSAIENIPKSIQPFETKVSNVIDYNKNGKAEVLAETKNEVEENKMIEQPRKNVQVSNRDNEVNTSKNTNDPDCTSSLDVLVGLLNEIQKITCQNQVVNSSNLEILNNTATNEEHKTDRKDVISIASLNKLRKLKSDSSVSLYMSNESSAVGNLSPNNFNSKLNRIDKEVNVNIDKELVSICTETSIKTYRPITTNRSANVSNSLVGVLSQPSNPSMFPFTDYNTLYFNNVFDNKSITKIIIELPKTDEEKHNKVSELKNTIVVTESMNNVSPVKPKMSRCIENFDFDPIIKMKRDILVTMYSILVLTVFAALSFPELLVIDG